METTSIFLYKHIHLILSQTKTWLYYDIAMQNYDETICMSNESKTDATKAMNQHYSFSTHTNTYKYDLIRKADILKDKYFFLEKEWNV